MRCPQDEPCPDRSIPVRNTDRHPYRYSAEARGNLGGAGGTFRCGSTDSTAATSCTVQNTGGGFVFDRAVVLRSVKRHSQRQGPRCPVYVVRMVEHRDSYHLRLRHQSWRYGCVEPALQESLARRPTTASRLDSNAISGTLVANQGHGEFTANARLTADFGERNRHRQHHQYQWSTRLGDQPHGGHDRVVRPW